MSALNAVLPTDTMPFHTRLRNAEILSQFLKMSTPIAIVAAAMRMYGLVIKTLLSTENAFDA